MNDCEETNGKAIKALIVFREISDTDNLFAPILCDAIRMTGIDVQCSKEAFWESDTAYDIIHFQWPEEVVGWNCEDPDVIRRLEERIRFFRSRGAHFVYTRHNVRPHYANDIISRAYDIIETQSDIVVHMGHFSADDFAARYPQSRNVVILHHIYEYTYQEDISEARARQYLNLPQNAFIVTAFGKFRNREEIRMVLGAFHAWKRPHKLLLAPRLFLQTQQVRQELPQEMALALRLLRGQAPAQPLAASESRRQRRPGGQLRPTLLYSSFGPGNDSTQRYPEFRQHPPRLPLPQSGGGSRHGE